MKTLRQLHLYLGTLFAPLILYFCLSGAWQVYRLNDLPRNETPTATRALLHALSNPHTHSTLPGRSPRDGKSAAFDVAAVVCALGMIATAVLGLVLAWRFAKRPALVAFCFAAGVVLPVVFLFL